MPIISILSPEFSHADEVARRVADELNYPLLSRELLEHASRRFHVPAEDLSRAMTGRPFVFNQFTHKREKYLAFLRSSLVELLAGNVVYLGPASLLIPREIGDVLKVCLLADAGYRAGLLAKSRGVSEKEALHILRESDTKLVEWAQYLLKTSPWDKALYDIKIPMHTTPVEMAAELIRENSSNDVLKPAGPYRRTMEDFRLAADVGLVMAESGIYHKVECAGGDVTVVVDEYKTNLEHLEKELRVLLDGVKGFRQVKVNAGPNYRPSAIFTPSEFEMPSKVLLVDDEQDFVLTLSERLEMRDISPAVAYDGEQALSILREEEPDVIVLDLKMPGINGIEVLRKVKKEHPAVEVIILTGHGSEQDRDLCMQLGAFAYLEKPVDIETLSQKMKEAYAKISSDKRA